MSALPSARSALQKFTGKTKPQDAVARSFARCFTSPDGQIVLEHLHQQTLCRVTDPVTAHDNLRFLEGQRQLVLWMIQMIAKGQTHTA